MRFFYFSKTQLVQASLEEIKEKTGTFCIITKKEAQNIAQFLEYPNVILSMLQKSDEIVKEEVYEQYSLGTLERITWKNGHYEADFLDFVLSKNQLVVMIPHDYIWLDEWSKRLNEGETAHTLGYLFYRLLDCLLSEDQSYLDEMEYRLESLEEDILNEKEGNFIHTLIHMRRQIARFKKHYYPLTDLVENLLSGENEPPYNENKRYFKILANRINRYNHMIDAIDEYATHVREAYDAGVDIKQNRMMKYFTLVTTLFFPLTVIVGWYGMNFESMPEVTWKYGYLYVIIISVLSSVICLWCFKKKKWL